MGEKAQPSYMPTFNKLVALSLGLLSFIGCKNDEEIDAMRFLSSSINGYSLNGDLEQIPIDLKVELVFSGAVDLAALTNAIRLSVDQSEVMFNVELSNANSKATIDANLEYATDYTFTISTETIGVNGASLDEPVAIQFTTMENDVIRSMAPCTGDCLQSVEFDIGGSKMNFWVYANYPLDLTNAIWEDLNQAVIVVHGQNRDADNYYQYMSSTFSDLSLSEHTLLIAPWFRDDQDVESADLYWTSSSWREGGSSNGSVAVSSYALVDSLLQLIADKEHFPALNEVIVTGHSSGGMFTHLFSASSSSEENLIGLNFEYIVANSQYFYYPTDYRYGEETNGFFLPVGCSGYNQWPYGFDAHPSYITSSDSEAFDVRFASRSVTYLLGNESSNDGALNTTNCKATLLGSTRYQRGENMYRVMDEFFTDHHHSRIVVESIGHDGEGMYKSGEFKTLLMDLVN